MIMLNFVGCNTNTRHKLPRNIIHNLSTDQHQLRCQYLHMFSCNAVEAEMDWLIQKYEYKYKY